MIRALALLTSILWLATAGAYARAAEPVVSGVQTVTGARLIALADKTVRAIVTDPDREIAPAYNVPDQRIPAGDVSIEIQPAQINATYIAIPLGIKVDGRMVRTVFAGYRVITFVHTVVATRDLPVGTLLTESDLTVGRVATTGRTPLDPVVLVGRQLAVPVVHGLPLYLEYTRINELVRAGQPVVLIIHSGPVMLSADVIARSGGGLGQQVAVYNPATRKELSGVVTAAGLVEYTLPGGEQTQ